MSNTRKKNQLQKILKGRKKSLEGRTLAMSGIYYKYTKFNQYDNYLKTVSSIFNDYLRKSIGYFYLFFFFENFILDFRDVSHALLFLWINFENSIQIEFRFVEFKNVYFQNSRT